MGLEDRQVVKTNKTGPLNCDLFIFFRKEDKWHQKLEEDTKTGISLLKAGSRGGSLVHFNRFGASKSEPGF